MNKIAIITDSTTDMYEESLKKNENVFVIPMHITYNDGREFRDGIDIDAQQLTKDLDEFRPKTASPMGADFMNTIFEIEKQGYTHVIGVFLSSGISGTYKSAVGFGDLLNGKGIQTYILPCKGVSMIIGHVVLELAKMARETGNYEKTICYGKDLLDRQCVYFAVESLKYLILGGRIPKIEGTVGELLDIKPIIGVQEDGSLAAVGKVRGRKRSIKKVMEFFEQEIAQRGVEKIFVVHGDRMNDALHLKELFQELYPEQEIEIHNLSALLTAHTGPGTIGAAVFLEK